MASNTPGLCCLTGFKHQGTSEGEMKIGEIQTYFTHPTNQKDPNTALIYLSDIFGISHNGKLLADEFARQGYFTIYPDLLYGDHLTLEDDYHSGRVDMAEWASRHGPETVDPVIEGTIGYLRGVLGVEKVGAVEYCFGGKYVARFLKDGKIDSGYTAHPSFVTEDDLAGIQRPFSIAAAGTQPPTRCKIELTLTSLENDPIFPQEKRLASENILVKTEQLFQMNLISGVQHGFAPW